MESSSSTSSVLQDVNALRSLVVSVLPQLLMKLDLIGDKLEHAPTTPNAASTTRVEISTQTEGAFVDGNPGVPADEILEEDLLWTAATLPAGIKVESSSEGIAAEVIEDNNLMRRNMDFRQVVSCSLAESPVESGGSAVCNAPVLNLSDQWREQSMSAEEYIIDIDSSAARYLDCKPDLPSTSDNNQAQVMFDNHESRINSGERRRSCLFCGKNFQSPAHCERHERIHTGEKPFKCSFCFKGFCTNSHLIRHRRTHTGERPFKCTHCSKAFMCQSDLVKHERIHTGVKPYKCDRCTEAFAVQCNLVSHQRIHHSVQKALCSRRDLE